MAIKLLTYGGIVTKSKAMKSMLLTQEDFEKIAGCGSVPDIITLLKEHKGYKDIFKDSDIASIHRGDIEHELIHAYQMTYAKLYRFAEVKQRKVLEMLFSSFEIQALRMCLQGIMRSEDLIDLSMFREFFENHSKINIEKITSAADINAFVEALRGTDYHDVLTEVQKIPNPTLFDYETRLNIFYYEKLWRDKEKYLKGKEKKAYTAVLGQQIDLLNLMWIYRFKLYFDTDNGKIMRSIIPIHYRLKKKMVADMVATENVAAFQELLKKCAYRKLLADGDVDKSQIERTYHAQIKRTFEASARKNPLSIVPIQYFLYLKEREMDHITTAIECVRYDLPADKTLEILSQQ